jgi:predicted neuraminidase
MNYKVDRETAENDFNRFAQQARLRFDRIRDDNERKDVESDRERFIEEVMVGCIEVDDDGWATVITQSEELPQVRFGSRPRASIYKAADRSKSTKEMDKMFAMIADAAGVTKAHLYTLDQYDLTNVLCVFGLFLAS